MSDSLPIYSIDMVNQLDREQFVDLLGPIFEETPEIAANAWFQRPFASPAALYQVMLGVMRSLSPEQQLALIRAHPDLGTKAKMAPDSIQEQASVGLNRLSPEKFTQFQSLNQAYRTKFGFPFIIAVKHHTQATILQAFEQRLQHDSATEQTTALDEIAKIARLRLARLIGGFDVSVA
jgi:2-oxo-4-hydroxy-4-carboxy-5-ureidoimidazoline decarboxylase